MSEFEIDTNTGHSQVQHFECSGNSNPLQYSCLENPMDRGTWRRLLSRGSQRVGHN